MLYIFAALKIHFQNYIYYISENVYSVRRPWCGCMFICAFNTSNYKYLCCVWRITKYIQTEQKFHQMGEKWINNIWYNIKHISFLMRYLVWQPLGWLYRGSKYGQLIDNRISRISFFNAQNFKINFETLRIIKISEFKFESKIVFRRFWL